jgi:hypothetical protein
LASSLSWVLAGGDFLLCEAVEIGAELFVDFAVGAIAAEEVADRVFCVG